MLKLIFHLPIRSVQAIQKCSKSTDKAKAAKALNYENKALFGAVIKKKGRKKSSLPKKDLPATISPPSNETEMSSEMFWMTRNTSSLFANDNFKKKSYRPKSENVEPKSLDNNLIVNSIQDIPFTDKELRSITQFPLHVEQNNKKLWEPLLEKDHKKLPSVGKILQATMPEASRQALIKWKLKQIAELGEDGFAAMQQSHLDRGSAFHNCLNHYFNTNEEPPEDSEHHLIWDSVNNGFLSKYQPNPLLSEASLVHPYLKYKGIVDCVSEINGDLCVIEWKKSDKRKPTIRETYDAPIQLVAYLGALSADQSLSHMISRGFVVIGYTDGNAADSYRLELSDLHKYWHIWTSRVQEYWTRYRDGTLPEPV